MWLSNSSVGRKVVMSVTGIALVLFLTFHMAMNLVALVSANGYNMVCEFLGANWYALVATVGLAALFIIHIIYGCGLTWQNVKARGGYKRYEASSVAAADSWSAKNMFVLGIIILGILAFHLTHFWAKMQLAMFTGAEEGNPYELLNLTFGRWWVLALYLVWFVAVWFHLCHGFWSMFQTVGWNNQTWFKRLKVIGIVVATLIFLGFAAVGINAFLQANALI